MRFFLLHIASLYVLNLFGQTDNMGKVYIAALPSKPIYLKQNKDSVFNKIISGNLYHVFSYRFDKEFDGVTLPDSLNNGKWIAFFRDDTTKIALLAEYKKNRCRKVKIFYFNGNLRVSYSLKNGLDHGICRIYNENGNIYAVAKFKNGELIEDWGHFFDENGKKKSKRWKPSDKKMTEQEKATTEKVKKALATPVDK